MEQQNPEEQIDTEEQVLTLFQIEFVKNNRTKFDEFLGGLQSGDIKLAYRIAHTLKGNARQLGRAGMAEIAAEIERLLADGHNQITEAHILRFQNELNAALAEFAPLFEEDASRFALPNVTLPPADSTGEAQKNSVLIVNDDETNLKTLEYILQPTYTIYTASNGEDAVTLAQERTPDLIVLDIVMPEMDGYGVISRLKAAEKTKDIPIIFITSLNSHRDEVKGLSSNAADYISVPYNAEIVRLRVRNQITIVNQIRTIQRLVRIDQLTNLPNRRYFDEQLRQDWGMAVREGLDIGILMIDIDNFKRYNDTYGHQQGDAALKATAATAARALKRNGDFIARWGGEEFITLLPNTNLDGALEIAERIRAAVAETDIPCAGGSFKRVTVSIGVHSAQPTPETSVDAFISGADEALYAAKKMGRNRACPYNA